MPELNPSLEAVKPDFLKFINLIKEYRLNETGKEGLIFIPMEKIGSAVPEKFIYNLHKSKILNNFDEKDGMYLSDLGFTINKKDIKSNYIKITGDDHRDYLVISCNSTKTIEYYLNTLYIPGNAKLIVEYNKPYAYRQGKKYHGKFCSLSDNEHKVLSFLYNHANEPQSIDILKQKCELSETEISSACTSVRRKLREHLGYNPEEMRQMIPRYKRGYYALHLP